MFVENQILWRADGKIICHKYSAPFGALRISSGIMLPKKGCPPGEIPNPWALMTSGGLGTKSRGKKVIEEQSKTSRQNHIYIVPPKTDREIKRRQSDVPEIRAG